MKTVIFQDKITGENYHEFIDRVINIFRLSSPDKYILFSLKLVKQDCIMKLSILRNDGEGEEYEEIIMDNNSEFFFDFLNEFVQRLREVCEVVSEDYVNLDDDYYVAYRMITKYNDLVTMDGLTETQAKQLLGKEEKKVDLSVTNNKGNSTLAGFLFLIVVLAISFVTVYMIVEYFLREEMTLCLKIRLIKVLISHFMQEFLLRLQLLFWHMVFILM